MCSLNFFEKDILEIILAYIYAGKLPQFFILKLLVEVTIALKENITKYSTEILSKLLSSCTLSVISK